MYRSAAAPDGRDTPLEKRPGCFGRVFFGGLGFFLVGMGIIAAVVPLIPAAPFFMAAVGCFAKASPRFKNWLVNNKWLGPYFGGAADPRAFSPRRKAVALLIFWAVGVVAGVFLFDGFFWRCGLVMTLITLTIHILLLKPPRTRVVAPSEEVPNAPRVEPPASEKPIPPASPGGA